MQSKIFRHAFTPSTRIVNFHSARIAVVYINTLFNLANVNLQDSDVTANGDSSTQLNVTDVSEKTNTSTSCISNKECDGIKDTQANTKEANGDSAMETVVNNNTTDLKTKDETDNSKDFKRHMNSDATEDFEMQDGTNNTKDSRVQDEGRVERSEGGGGVASRLRADLAHLVLGAAPAVAASAGVVGLAKHLCGVATGAYGTHGPEQVGRLTELLSPSVTLLKILRT